MTLSTKHSDYYETTFQKLTLLPELRKRYSNDVQTSKISNKELGVWLHGCYQSGKSYFIKKIYKEKDWPFVEFDVTKFSSTGNAEDDERRILREMLFQICSTMPALNWDEGDQSLIDDTLAGESLSSRAMKYLFAQLHKKSKTSIVWLIWVGKSNDLPHTVNKIVELADELLKLTKYQNPHLIFESWFEVEKFPSLVKQRDADWKFPVNKDGSLLPTLNMLERVQEFQFDHRTSFNKQCSDEYYPADTWFNKFLKAGIRNYDWTFFENEKLQKAFRGAILDWAGNHYGANKLIFELIEKNPDFIEGIQDTDTSDDSLRNQYSRQIEDCLEASEERVVTFIEALSDSFNVNRGQTEDFESGKNLRFFYKIGINLDKRNKKMIKLLNGRFNTTRSHEKMVASNTYLAVTSAMEMAKWVWPAAQPAIAEISEKVGNAVGDVFAQKLKYLFGNRADRLNNLPEDQEEQVIKDATNILSSFNTYSDKDLLEDVQRALISLLSDGNNYILQDGLWEIYKEYVTGAAALNIVIAKHSLLLNPQAGMAQEIVHYATVRHRLPELIQDMSHSIQ